MAKVRQILHTDFYLYVLKVKFLCLSKINHIHMSMVKYALLVHKCCFASAFADCRHVVETQRKLQAKNVCLYPK